MFFKRKNQEVERLKAEVKKLKQELDSANLIIGSVTSLMLTLKQEIETIKKNVLFDED